MTSARSTFSNLSKILRSLLLPETDYRAAVERAAVDHDALRARYAASPLARAPDTFVLYRVIGNDLPPRHRSGQSLANLRFLLDHEPVLPACEKRWIVNRIADPAVERPVLDLLRERAQPVLHLPFDPAAYRRLRPEPVRSPWHALLAHPAFRRLAERKHQRLLCALQRPKNLYVMNNNGARNAALRDGRARAKWVLPFDGNCFFTLDAWERLRADVAARPWLKHFVVPMARVLDNQALLRPGYAPEPREEPQLVFRRDTLAGFNEAFPYGRRPKVELFWHLGVPGPWDLWTESSWDQPRRPLSTEAFQFGLAGWVARLFSGAGHLEIAGRNMPAKRGVARQQGILAFFETLDRLHSSPASASPVPEPSFSPLR